MTAGLYRSTHRERLRCWFQSHAGQAFSASELAAALAAEGTPMPTATLYRNLGQLVTAGFLIQLTAGDGRGERYVHRRAGDAGLLCCRGCGHVEALACSHVSALSAHLAADHRFHIDGDEMVFSGLCNRCQHVKGDEDAPLERPGKDEQR